MFIAMPNNVAFCTAFQHLSLNNRFACVGFFCLCVLSKICRFCEMPHSFLIFKRFKAYLCSVLLHQPGEYDLCTDEEKNVVLWTGRRQIFTQPHFALLTFAGTVCGDLSKRQRKKDVCLFSLCNWIIIEEAIFIEGNKKNMNSRRCGTNDRMRGKLACWFFFSSSHFYVIVLCSSQPLQHKSTLVYGSIFTFSVTFRGTKEVDNVSVSFSNATISSDFMAPGHLSTDRRLCS